MTASQELDVQLGRLISQLDAAIDQAVENPLLFVDCPLLQALAGSCAALGAMDQAAIERTCRLAAERRQAEDLLWGVRARAGRLTRLLDAAGRFYSRCFSPFAHEGLAYGVHGEWSAAAVPSYLTVDC